MNMDVSQIIIVIFLILNIITFILGYFIGKISKINIVNSNVSDTSFIPIDKQKNSIEKINIDETKVVSKINTSSLEKKYDNLGNTTISDENITDSINKLKKLKE
ncbi:MAG: hypothetical protein EBQ89_04225 [Alphaproteobacteria bacterium]|nr:hypothetical protein [Alphaproteobacteria bacterium]